MSNDAFSHPDVAPLATAVRSGDAAEIQRQLQRIDANVQGAQGETLLMEAIDNNQQASVDALLAGGADPNRANARGDTAVHAAAFSTSPGLLQALLQHGGNADARNALTGETALMRALLSPNADQYAVLLAAGANPDQADNNGSTPLHVAGRTNAGAAILRLLEQGASPLLKDSRGDTFQEAYFGYRRDLLNARALDERHAVVTWLKTHGVPLSAKVDAGD